MVARLHSVQLATAILVGILASGGWASRGQAQFFNPQPPSEPVLTRKVSVDKVDDAAAAHLVRVQAHLDSGQWDEAVETLRQVADSHGSQLIELAPGRWISVRDYCHRKIAGLGDEALTLYRDRVDARAREMYERGVAERDAELLGEVVEQTFCSRWGDDALAALGEIELERGHYQAARTCWQQILPLAAWERMYPLCDKKEKEEEKNVKPEGEDPKTDVPRGPLWMADLILTHQPIEGEQASLKHPLWRRYPDTDLDLGEIFARLVLVSIREGDLERATGEMNLLRALYPDAKMQVAGREVACADWLADELSSAIKTSRPEQEKSDWPTFAGNAERDSTLSQPLRLPEGVTTIGDLLPVRGSSVPRRVAEDSSENLLSYHPVLATDLRDGLGNLVEKDRDLVIVCDGRTIRAFDAATGQGAWGKQDGIIYPPSAPRAGEQSPGFKADDVEVPRFSLTVRGHLLFARMGSPETSTYQEERFGQIDDRKPSTIVCLDLRAQGRFLRELKADNPRWAFEGAPLSDGTNVFVGMRRGGVQPQCHVACFDLATGRMKWRQLVAAAETPAQGQRDEVTHNLLTMHEGVLYYNTNLGAVAALEADSGQIRWVYVYPRAESFGGSNRPKHWFRDLNPPLVYRGMLFVIPSDYTGVLALDAATGVRLWDSVNSATDAVHLLGVCNGRLVATGDVTYWFEFRGGGLNLIWPSLNDGFRPRGRGLIAGDQVIWPAFQAGHPRLITVGLKSRINGAVAKDQVAHPPQDVPAVGNVIAAGKYMVIATGDRLYVFHPKSATATPEKTGGRPRQLNRTAVVGDP